MFSESLSDLQSYIDDELIELRRQEVLEAINGWFQIQAVATEKLQAYKDQFERLKKLCFKLLWERAQLRKHITPEIMEEILIERQVNETDPDFSFEKSVLAQTDSGAAP